MNEGTIRRLLGIVEKTGDKVIVTDPAGEHPYVLMGLDQYERMIGGEKKSEKVEDKPIMAPVPKTSTKPQTPPWRAKLGLDAVEPPVQDLFKASSRAKIPTASVEEPAMETEGEEQFYLEPLE